MRRRALLPLLSVLVVLVVLVLAGCGGGGGSNSATTSTESAQALAAAAAKAEIKSLWVTFFNGAQPAGKAAMLQNGARFSGPLATIAQSVLARQLSATVSDVALDGPNKATVTYTLLLNDKPVLKNATGTAVRAGGRWLVGVGSFCSLLALEGATPPSCPTAPK